ncbi:response regulator [Undibacterium umbellatum]|uniref:histidine kinase n=1 Tax=Undibacterium umbellatum TaxID=2762300 RepID=A0ABR6Z872_9BURK|nr:response regulator [Undibacterium umbellatum]MBC3907983.1 response regulator [Undibacterium umbellatum]
MTAQQNPMSAARVLLPASLWFFVLAVAGMWLTRGENQVSILWFANALAVAYMHGQGRRRQLQILALTMVASLAANLLTGNNLAVSTLYTLANAAEVALVSYTIRHAGLAQDFEHSSSDMLKMILLGFLLPCACSATLAAALVAWVGLGEFELIFTGWYVSASLGLILIYPLVRRMRLQAAPAWASRIDWQRFARYALPILVLVVVALLYLPLPFLYILVALTFATHRLNFDEAHLLTVLAITCLGLMLSLGHVMPLGGVARWQLLFVYLPILITSVPPMLMAAARNENQIREAERQRFSEELQKSKQSLQSTIDHMPAMIGYWDQKLHNHFANAAYEKWFGLTPDQIRGMHISEVLGPAIYEQNSAHMHAALAGEARIFERSIVDGDGKLHNALTHYTPHIVKGKVQGFYVFASDITPLKEAQLQENRAQAKFASVIEAASEFAIITTDMVGTITLFSKGAERMLGYGADELVNLHTPAILHLQEELRARGEQLTAELGYPVEGFEVFVAKARRGLPQSQQWTFISKQGQHIPVNLVISNIHDEHQQTIGFLGIATDISRQKQLESSLIAARDQAEMASRTKSEFLANMSHEIRTPMNAVLGMSYLLGQTDLNANQRNYLDMIRSSGQSLLGILNDILDISKIEAGRIELSPTRFHLKDVLSALANMMSVNVGEKQLELSMGIDTAVPRELIGDALRLQQVLINITGNAIKFTEQGEVSLLVQLNPQEAQTGDRLLVQFIIRDTGIGMSAEQISRLFSAFEQADASTSRRFGGTGLGLAISKRLLDLMGGEISVQSQEGTGTEFVVSVPMQVAPPLADDSKPASLTTSSSQARKILVVDDNATSRSYIAKTIQAWGWQADTASSGEQALQKVREHLAHMHDPDYDYCAILIDWHMPGQDGLTTLAAIKALLASQQIPLILMTSAYDRSALNMDGKPDAPDAVLLKPVTGSSLYDVLQETSHHLQHATPLATANLNSAPVVIGTGSFTGKQILLVEDNYFNQIVATKILEQTGAVVKLANNGSEAVEIMKSAAGQFDLVLMDVQMPVMDGWTATDILRNELAMNLPILAMTAGVMTSEREHCLAAGMNDVISKPIDIDQMLAALARYLSPAQAATPAPSPALPPVLPTVSNQPASHIPPITNADADSRPTSSQPAITSTAFDPAKLMALAKGNPALIKTLSGVIQNMMNHASDDFALAISHWQQGDTQQAARGLHTLRGSIGTLGAKDFAQAALALENAIVQQDQARLPELLKVAQAQLQLTIDSVQAWLQAQNNDQAARPPQITQLSPAQLQEFKTLLQDQNMKASSLYKELQASLQQDWSAERQQAMENSMLALDFATALDLLGRADISFSQANG